MYRDLNTRIIDLTAGELMDLIKAVIDGKEPEPVKGFVHDERYVYQIDGIAKLLGCSHTTVYEYRKQGWIKPAIKQIGRKIVCDAPLALELFARQGKTRKNKQITSKS